MTTPGSPDTSAFHGRGMEAIIRIGVIILFTGAIVLSLGYRIFLTWLEPEPATE